MKTKKKIDKVKIKNILIIISIFIFILLIQRSMSKYVFTKHTTHANESTEFYFESDIASEDVQEYTIDNWDGESIKEINFNVKNYIDELQKTGEDIKYNISAYCGELPSEYQQVKYLESTGTQYIDLQRVPNMTDIIEQKFQRKDTSTTTQSWYGSMPSSSDITPRICLGSSDNGFFTGMNGTFYFQTSLDTDIHTIKFWAMSSNTTKVINNGVETSRTFSFDIYSPAVTVSSYLFARHGNDGVQVTDGVGTRIFYHREYLQDGTLVLNCIPCYRKSDNKPGMYDTVTNTFYTNQGTGEFIIGQTVLPSEYQEVEYIESTGTQYIDTGYKAVGNLKFEGMVYTDVEGTEMAIGSVSGSNGGRTTGEFGFSPYDNGFFIYSNNASARVVPTSSIYNTSLKFITKLNTTAPYKEVSLDIDGGVYSSSNVENINYIGNTIQLFKMDTKYYYIGRTYYLKIYDNETIVRNFIPCYRKSDNKPGMYDTVTNTFYTNQGTGEFILGPILGGVPEEYQEVEYIESTGTQYIDLQRVPNMTDIIEQKFQRKDTSTTTQSWYGSMPSSSKLFPRIAIGVSSEGFFVGNNTTGYCTEADTDIHTIKYWHPSSKTGVVIYDGVQIDVTFYPTNQSAYSPAVTLSSYLFARHGNNGVQVTDGVGTRIFYHREYLQDGTLVLNCIPCYRKSDNKPGMYDTVNNVFYTNQGTGEFILGPKLLDIKILDSNNNEINENSELTLTGDEQSLNNYKLKIIPNVELEDGKEFIVNLRLNSISPYTKKLNTRIKLKVKKQKEYETSLTNYDDHVVLNLKTNTVTKNISIDYNNGKLSLDRSNNLVNDLNITKNENTSSITIPKTRLANNSNYEIIFIKNDYVKDGLMLQLDAINNTGNGHDSTATTWKDLSGNGNDGTIHGANWTEDNGLYFDGVNDWVGIGKINPENLTVEVIMEYETHKTASENSIISNTQSGGITISNYDADLSRTNGEHSYINKNSFTIYTTQYNSVISNNDIEDNKKYILTGSYNGSKLKFWENGEETETSVSGTIMQPENNTILALGTNPSGANASLGYLNGKIYAVRIYNRALTDEEVARNYEIDKVRYEIDGESTAIILGTDIKVD